MFHITDEDQFMGLINQVAAEPIDEEPYSLVRDPKPVVETVCSFDGVQINLESWTKGDGVSTNSEKVGKAKTAPDPKLTKAAPKSVNEKKEDGKIVENDAVADKKKKDQIVEVNADAEVKAKTPADAGKGSSFDTVAKSAAKSNEGDAKSNKKFAAGCDKQKKVDLFKDGVKKLGVDAETKSKVDNFLKDFDEISKSFTAKTESVNAQMEGFGDVLKKGADKIKQGAKNLAGLAGRGLTKLGTHLNNMSQSGNKTDAKPSDEAPAKKTEPEDKSLTIKFNNSVALKLSDLLPNYNGPMRTLEDVSGKTVLAKYKGCKCWMRNDPTKGEPYVLFFNNGEKWCKWSSGSAVKSVFTGSEEPAEAPKTDASDGKATETTAENPAETTAEKPAETTAEKPAEATAETPAETTAEKPAEATAENPAEATAENPAEETKSQNVFVPFIDGKGTKHRMIAKKFSIGKNDVYVVIDSDSSILTPGMALKQFFTKDNESETKMLNKFAVYDSEQDALNSSFDPHKDKKRIYNVSRIGTIKPTTKTKLPKLRAKSPATKLKDSNSGSEGNQIKNDSASANPETQANPKTSTESKPVTKNSNADETLDLFNK